MMVRPQFLISEECSSIPSLKLFSVSISSREVKLVWVPSADHIDQFKKYLYSYSFSKINNGTKMNKILEPPGIK